MAASLRQLSRALEDGKGSKGGAVVRALASHQCAPGSNPGVDAICGLNLLLVLSLAPRGFSPGTPVFPCPQKPTFANSNSTRNQVHEEPLCGCATCKSLFFYLFYLFYLQCLKFCQRLKWSSCLLSFSPKEWTLLALETVSSWLRRDPELTLPQHSPHFSLAWVSHPVQLAHRSDAESMWPFVHR